MPHVLNWNHWIFLNVLDNRTFSNKWVMLKNFKITFFCCTKRNIHIRKSTYIKYWEWQTISPSSRFSHWTGITETTLGWMVQASWPHTCRRSCCATGHRAESISAGQQQGRRYCCCSCRLSQCWGKLDINPGMSISRGERLAPVLYSKIIIDAKFF